MIRSLICFALVATVLTASPTCDSKLKAADGTAYDLSFFADKIWQATQNAEGSTYTFNISICANSPYACAGSCIGPNTAGVCQSWGPAPVNARCFGHWDTANLLGLNSGHGFQITYSGGDQCGLCNPQGTRSTVVTLLCDPKATNDINWGTPYGANRDEPPTLFINGTSAHACPGGGLDGGWIFIIVVACLLFVYFIGGTIFNAAIRKQRGREMVPNSEFWCDLPSLVGDGFKFLIGKCRGQSSYTPVGA